MIEFVVFLGNYGKTYEQNRHNVAWLFADSLPYANLFSWQKKFRGTYASLDRIKLTSLAALCPYSQNSSSEGLFEFLPQAAQELPPKVYFLKPETFMNLSGESAQNLASFFKVDPKNMLVVHDELELPPGTVSLKWAGGLGGHNGLRSLNSAFGSADFWRLRIGIGRPGGIKEVGQDISGYVLSDFSASENQMLDHTFALLGNVFTRILLEGPQKYQKDWAKKNLTALQ